MTKKDENLFMDEEAEVVQTSRDLVGDIVVGDGVPSAKTKKEKATKAKSASKPRKKKEAVEESNEVQETQVEKTDEEALKPKKAPEKRWYIVNTYSGYENKVKVNLEKRIEYMNMSEKIFRVEVPQKTITQVKAGKKTEKDEKVFPGYVLVEMIMDEDSWYVVRHTAGVTRFVGSAKKPIPARDSEIKKVLGRATTDAPQRIELDVKAGDKVRIISGPFAEFVGDITEVYPDKAKLRANVSIFGRETPVELEYKQIQKL